MSGDYVCNICGKQFLTKGGLSGHTWAVHNTVESPCTGCGKIFRNKKHLADHMSNTHAENQRFLVTSKLERVHAAIILQQKAI